MFYVDHLIHLLPAILRCQHLYHPAQAGENGLGVDKWPADDHIPCELRARIPSQAVCLQVCAPHLTHSSHSFMALKADEQGQGKEGHGAPALRTRCWATGTPASSMPLQVGPYTFSPSHFLGLLLDRGSFRIKVLVIKCVNVCHRSWMERSPSGLQGIARWGMKPREGTGKVPDAEAEDTYKRIFLRLLGKVLFKPLPLRKM